MANPNYCAYVAIKTEPKATKDVFRKIGDTKYVKEAHTVTGRFDIIARIEADTQKELFSSLLGEIRCYPGVQHTETWTVCE